MLEIDEIDSKILNSLINDSRTKTKNIAKDTGISSTAIKNRITLLKKNKLIIKAVLVFNLSSFGYNIPVLLGVNIEPQYENNIISLIKKHTLVAGIDRTIGKYNLCLFVFAKNLDDLERFKHKIKKEKGVKDIEVNIWGKYHFNWNNIDKLNRGG